MNPIKKSDKLNGVCYDIRGPVLDHAYRLEEEGHRILKLNIGNPAPFGFSAPDEIIQDVIRNLANAEGYTASKGLFAARKAIMHECQRLEVPGVEIEDIFLGNGASELIVMAMQALLTLPLLAASSHSSPSVITPSPQNGPWRQVDVQWP